MAFDSIANPNDPNGLGPSVHALQESLLNIAELTKRLNALMANNTASISATTANAADITASLKASNADIAKTLSNLSTLSQQLKDAGLDKTAKSATVAIDSVIVAVGSLRQTLTATEKTVQKVDVLAQNLTNGTGSAGKLLTDPELYDNLVRTSRHLALLEQDLRLNPKRYTTVKLKLFGKNKTGNYTNPIEDPAYQHVIDSLERDYQRRMKAGGGQ
jgi:phospholipid/cholesterol/gamma-HCH transport system substrate-binding protein